MEEFIKKQKRQRIKNYFLSVIICVLLVFITALLYLLYQNIYLPNTSMLTPQRVEVTRTSQTVEQAQQEDKTVTQVLEEINECVVGISKLKDTGNTIFLENHFSSRQVDVSHFP